MNAYQPGEPRRAWILRPIEGLAGFTPLGLAALAVAGLALAAYAAAFCWVLAAMAGK